MIRTPEDIYAAFDGKLIGSTRMKMYVCDVVSLLPEENISFLTKHCWFISSMEDAWAFAFTGNDLKNQNLIFLSDELLLQEEDQVHYSIAHEIGHVLLQHKNAVQAPQTNIEIEKQEKEADEFAKKYVSPPEVF